MKLRDVMRMKNEMNPSAVWCVVDCDLYELCGGDDDEIPEEIANEEVVSFHTAYGIITVQIDASAYELACVWGVSPAGEAIIADDVKCVKAEDVKSGIPNRELYLLNDLMESGSAKAYNNALNNALTHFESRILAGASVYEVNDIVEYEGYAFDAEGNLYEAFSDDEEIVNCCGTMYRKVR